MAWLSFPEKSGFGFWIQTEIILRCKENRFNKRSTQGGEEKRKDLLEFRNPNPIRFRLVRTIFVLLASPSEPIK